MILIFRGEWEGCAFREKYLAPLQTSILPTKSGPTANTQMAVKDQKPVQIRHPEAGIQHWEVRESGSVDVSCVMPANRPGPFIYIHNTDLTTVTND